MKKEQLVELTISYVCGGAIPSDLDSRYHPLTIEKFMDIVYAGIMYQVSANAIKYRDWGQLDQYSKPFPNVPCVHDNARDEWYSTLPASIIELPMNRGIRMISPMQDQPNKFKNSDDTNADTFNELEVQNVMGYTSFYREGPKVFYRNFREDYAIPGLLYKLLIPLSEFEDEDEVGIPGQMSINFMMMVKEALDRRAPEDQDQDNNSKQV